MQKLMKRFHKDQKGFTLVELMVVVVIIGILVAIAIPIYQTVTKNAEEKSCFANQRTVEGAVQMYLAQDPTNEASDVDNDLTVDGLVQEVHCPSGGNYTLTDGVLTCSEHDHYTD